MRKYYQVALAIIAAVSLISLLFYRHEYNKLRYVLEVFNYFGKPIQKSIEINCTNDVPSLANSNVKFEEPFSSWQRLNDDLYVYSAYSINKKEIQVIGFGSSNSFRDIQCVIFFDDEINPVFGSFKYVSINGNLNATNIDKNSNYNGYRFYCTYVENKIPVGITFYTKYNTNLNDTPILPVKSVSYGLNYTNIGLCVSPPSTKPMKLLEMISFINFYNIIGTDNFIIYDFGISNQMHSDLKELSHSQNPYWKFTYTVVSWNFPFPGIDPTVIKNLIQADCLYRTYNKVMYVITLSWEEYIVLRYHHSLVDLMIDFKQSRLKADRYKLKTFTFCTQQAKNVVVKNSTLLIFNRIYFNPNILDNQSVYIYDAHKTLKKKNVYTREIGKDLVTINRYTSCLGNLNREREIKDISILRFAEDFQNSLLFRKLMIKNKLL